MKSKTFIIKTLTNLHAGSGDENYGVVDNQVQRDPVTELPIINSSSLKGALREFASTSGISDNDITKIFGGKDNAGGIAFLSANLLFYPIRSNVKPYYLGTSSNILKQFVNDLTTYKSSFSEKDEYSKLTDPSYDGISAYGTEKTEIIIEDDKATPKMYQEKLSTIVDIKEVALLNGKDAFKPDLPVIARNHLENGTSKNLWYEEVVPRNTIFYFSLLYKTEDEGLVVKFTEKITSEPVQIGANASIGYGLCSITELK